MKSITCKRIMILMSVVMLFSFLIPTAYAQEPQPVEKYLKKPEWKPYGGMTHVPEFADVGTLNQYMATTTWEFEIIDLVYDTLVIMGPDMGFMGRLAKDWEYSEDGLTWTFYLYENAKWHDGEPVTAEDCKYTYDTFMEYKMGRLADLVDVLNSTEAVDDYTFVLHLNYPYAPLLVRLVQSMYIVPEHIWKDVGDPTVFSNLEHPIGCGPFTFVERKPGLYITLDAYEDYHIGRPFIDTIVWPIISNADAMLLSLKSGDIDIMVWSIPYATVEKIKEEADPNIHLTETVETGARYTIFQCNRYPMGEAWFRHVVAYCLNDTEVVEKVYLGYADPGNMGRISPALPKYYNPDTVKENVYPYNLTKAAEILDEHGFKDTDGDGWREDDQGNPLELSMYSPNYDPCRMRWGDMIRDGLAEVGVKVDHKPLEWTMLVNYLNNEEFDMLIIGGVGSLDPDLLYSLYHTEGGWNIHRANYKNPDLDVKLEQQRKMVDESARIELIKELQEDIAEDIPLLNVVHQHFVFAYRDDKVAGWVTAPFFGADNYFSFMNIYETDLVNPLIIEKEVEVEKEVEKEVITEVEVIPSWVTTLEAVTGIAVVVALVSLYLAYTYKSKLG